MVEDDVYIGKVASKVATFDDFLKFLTTLRREIEDDSEASARLQGVFFQVVDEDLNFAVQFPDLDGECIEVPNQPDWNWLARLFVVGAFEN